MSRFWEEMNPATTSGISGEEARLPQNGEREDLLKSLEFSPLDLEEEGPTSGAPRVSQNPGLLYFRVIL
jgi:hypothetical protein